MRPINWLVGILGVAWLCGCAVTPIQLPGDENRPDGRAAGLGDSAGGGADAPTFKVDAPTLKTADARTDGLPVPGPGDGGSVDGGPAERGPLGDALKLDALKPTDALNPSDAQPPDSAKPKKDKP